MYKTTTAGYANLIRKCYEAKQPLMVYGGYGIGKSAIPKQEFKLIANSQKKEFVSWEETTDEQKMDCIKNADKYFVFSDQRVGQMDSTELRGIPNMMNTEMLKTIPYSWVIFMTQPKASGVVFFDEINLAPPSVQGTAYQIINDRTISDRKLADGVFCLGAGNRAEDKAHTFDMPAPLKDRFCEVEIMPDLEEFRSWALSNNVNPHLISFLSWKPNYLYDVDHKGNDKSRTPRGICRASKLLGEEEITTDTAFELIAISLGQVFATDFKAYAKYQKDLNWDKIYKNPEMLNTFEVDKLWAVAGGMTEQYKKKVDDKRFEDMMNVVMAMNKAEFAILTLKMMKEVNKTTFIKQVMKCKAYNTIVKDYGKFIADSTN